MNAFETAVRFDALAIGIIIGSAFLFAFFLWMLLDRREYEDPMDRRRRERAARSPDAPPAAGPDSRADDDDVSRRPA